MANHPVITEIITLEDKIPLELAIAAWLEAKSGRTKSTKTSQAYSWVITNFRETLQRLGLELDGDPLKLATLAQLWAAHGVEGGYGKKRFCLAFADEVI